MINLIDFEEILESGKMSTSELSFEEIEQTIIMLETFGYLAEYDSNEDLIKLIK